MKISFFFQKINNLAKKNRPKSDESMHIDEESTSTTTLDRSLNDEANKSNTSINDDLNDDEDSSLRYEKLHCFHLYKKYIKEMNVRMRQMKDELLASSLEFMLSLPKELVVHNLAESFDALQMSLELGINYLPMAESALASLEYWLNNISLARLKPFYPVLLAKFDDYLQLNKLSESDEQLAAQEKVFLLKLNYKGRGRRKVTVKLFEKNRSSTNSSPSDTAANDEMYENIQFRILKILGQLAGEMSHCLYDESGQQQQQQQLIAWDTNLHLKFYVPFIDIKPTIYFDRW